MNSSITELWYRFRNGLLDSTVLNKSTNAVSEFIPIELTNLLTLNNGQNLAKDGIFKLIQNGKLNNIWVKYKYIGKEIPFAIATEFDNGNVCLTINQYNKEISIVTFGFTPENYDLRDVSKYIQDKNIISKDLNEFLKSQIMFNEME